MFSVLNSIYISIRLKLNYSTSYTQNYYTLLLYIMYIIYDVWVISLIVTFSRIYLIQFSITNTLNLIKSSTSLIIYVNLIMFHVVVCLSWSKSHAHEDALLHLSESPSPPFPLHPLSPTQGSAFWAPVYTYIQAAHILAN